MGGPYSPTQPLDEPSPLSTIRFRHHNGCLSNRLAEPCCREVAGVRLRESEEPEEEEMTGDELWDDWAEPADTSQAVCAFCDATSASADACFQHMAVRMCAIHDTTRAVTRSSPPPFPPRTAPRLCMADMKAWA